jgi:hypothetical protein
VPSVIDGRGKLSDGAAVDSASASSVLPDAVSVSCGNTSTGASVSSRERVATRVPVTTTSFISSSASAAGESCAMSCGATASPSAAAMAARSVRVPKRFWFFIITPF